MKRVSVALLSLGLALHGCAMLGLSCTEVGCAGALSVLMDGALADGVPYEVSVEGLSVEPCVFTLPLQGYEDCASVDAEGQLVLSFFIPMGAAPDEVTLILLEDGEEAVRAVEAPSYGEPYYPNGKACDGGGCRTGDVAFTLPGTV